MNRFTVTERQAGRRLDVVVAEELHVSRSRAAALVVAGAVTLDGGEASKSSTVRAGQLVVIDDLEPAADIAPPALPPIVHRDDDVVVIDKPAGLVVHPGAGHRGDTLVDALRAAGVSLAPGSADDRPGIVHRLDRDTSGLMVVASSPRAYEALVGALARRELERRYQAMVVGVPAPPRGTIDGPIGRDPRVRTRFAIVEEGKPAVTHYDLATSGEIDTDGGHATLSVLTCRLDTGRTHQIRVHLSAFGHPIVGDPVYGSTRQIARALGIDRPALHADRLSFSHPAGGRTCTFDAPLPADLAAAWARIGAPPV